MSDQAAWELLRRPFEKDEIELLPKYTGKKDANGKIPRDAYGNCSTCGRCHPFPCVHLSYVGHAGITDRLNEVDPAWNWQPVSEDADGLPLIKSGGMWIKLTVLGVTRLGYGDAQGKTGPNAVKEMIGDAIRNAAMRFGVGTYLWSKSEKSEHLLEFDGDQSECTTKPPAKKKPPAEKKPAAKQPKPNPKKALWIEAKRLKDRAMSMGIKEGGITSWMETNILGPDGGPLGMPNYAESDIKRLAEYLKGRIADMESLEEERRQHEADGGPGELAGEDIPF